MNSPLNSSEDAIVIENTGAKGTSDPKWILRDLFPELFKGRYDVIAMSAELIAEVRIVQETPGDTGFKLGALDHAVAAADPKKPAKTSWLGITQEALDKLEVVRDMSEAGVVIQELRLGLADATKWQLRDKCKTDDARAHFDRVVAPMHAMTVMLDLEEALHLQFQAMRSGM